MSKGAVIIIFILVALAALSGYNYFFRPLEKISTPSSSEPSPTPPLSPEQMLLDTLSPQERVALLIAAPVVITPMSPENVSSSSGVAWVNDNKPGTVILYGSQISTTSAQTVIVQINSVKDAANFSPWIAVDHEGGTVQRLSGLGFTRVPNWRALCQGTEADRQAVLATSSAELSKAGIDIVFGPVVDVASSSAVLGSRVCSGLYEEVTQAGIEYATAFTAQGIMPVIKHFPGIGSTQRDLHTAYDSVTITQADALVYKLLLDQFPQLGVMVTHVGVENQFSEIPCTLSSTCVGELSQAYPKTLIFTDALDMVAAGHQQATQELLTLPQRAVASLAAGNHILVFSQDVQPQELNEVVSEVLNRYTEDTQFKQKVDAAASAVLSHKLSQSKQ